MLSTDDHRRDRAGLRYVYPVVSRRAGGVSVGINLNVNNACNWACLYCQVENLVRGGPPPLDLDRLSAELTEFLDGVLNGDFMQRHVPPEARTLVDVAFSGNGEPTSAPEFSRVINRVIAVLDGFGLCGKLVLRLITNGSFLHRPEVQLGIGALGNWGGEVWFKVDRVEPGEMREINGVSMSREKIARHLEISASLAPTWVQTCWFALDGVSPSDHARKAYCDLLRPLASQLEGIHLYGLARPSMQPAAQRLGRLSADEMNAFADQVIKETGIRVVISP